MGQNIHQCVLPVPVAIHDNLDEKQFHAARKALAYINSIDKNLYFYYIGRTSLNDNDSRIGKRLVIRMTSSFDIASSYQSKGCAVLDFRDASGCVKKQSIQISKERAYTNLDKLESLIRHELGHVLGLADLNSWQGIMSFGLGEAVNNPVQASVREIKALRELYND